MWRVSWSGAWRLASLVTLSTSLLYSQPCMYDCMKTMHDEKEYQELTSLPQRNEFFDLTYCPAIAVSWYIWTAVPCLHITNNDRKMAKIEISIKDRPSLFYILSWYLYPHRSIIYFFGQSVYCYLNPLYLSSTLGLHRETTCCPGSRSEEIESADSAVGCPFLQNIHHITWSKKCHSNQ